jgi:hypothetical protein
MDQGRCHIAAAATLAETAFRPLVRALICSGAAEDPHPHKRDTTLSPLRSQYARCVLSMPVAFSVCPLRSQYARCVLSMPVAFSVCPLICAHLHTWDSKCHCCNSHSLADNPSTSLIIREGRGGEGGGTPKAQTAHQPPRSTATSTETSTVLAMNNTVAADFISITL